MAFGGFEPAVREMAQMIAPGGSMALGEPFFTAHDAPEALSAYETGATATLAGRVLALPANVAGDGVHDDPSGVSWVDV